MIGLTVTFRYEDDFDALALRQIAAAARGKFEGLPGLRSKVFTINPELRQAVNFYIWESEDAARAFLDEAQLARIAGIYGVRPELMFVEIAALVDNGGL
jgi:hypothetical protein